MKPSTILLFLCFGSPLIFASAEAGILTLVKYIIHPVCTKQVYFWEMCFLISELIFTVKMSRLKTGRITLEEYLQQVIFSHRPIKTSQIQYFKPSWKFFDEWFLNDFFALCHKYLYYDNTIIQHSRILNYE